MLCFCRVPGGIRVLSIRGKGRRRTASCIGRATSLGIIPVKQRIVDSLDCATRSLAVKVDVRRRSWARLSFRISGFRIEDDDRAGESRRWQLPVVASRFLFPAPGRDAVTTRRSAPSLQLPRQTAQDTCLMHSDARILQSPSRLVARKQES